MRLSNAVFRSLLKLEDFARSFGQNYDIVFDLMSSFYFDFL